jgi:16S rRNA U516 pseudouridylate synthase RsuA-like enzyme
MTTVKVSVSEAKAEALRRMARRCGLGVEDLVAASIADLVARPERDFERAARRVLERNRELYRRLA